MAKTKKKGRRKNAMAKLEVVEYPDPVLTQVSQRVIEFDNNLRDLIRRMFEVCRLDSKGAGLAAVQVGQLKSVIVVVLPNYKRAMINPRIVKYGGEDVTENEGCLSHPGKEREVTRPDLITVRYNNMAEDMLEEDCSGLIARVIQHEVDHVNGINIVDWEKGKLMKERKERGVLD